MSKRQRFFVELMHDQVTVVSWKKLVEDAAAEYAPIPISPSMTSTESTRAAAAMLTSNLAFPAKILTDTSLLATTLKNTTAEITKARRRLKLPKKRSVDQNHVSLHSSTDQTPLPTSRIKMDFDKVKGKVYRFLPANTSGRSMTKA